MAVLGVARGVVCWDSCVRSGGSGLVRMDSRSLSGDVLQSSTSGCGGVKWNWEDGQSRCVLMWRSVRLGWDPGNMLLGETEPWCQWR